MVMVINRRIPRVLLANRSQYIGAILLVILSSFTFTLMTQFAGNFERLANEFQNGSMQENATFTTAQSIANLPELEAAAGAMVEEGQTLDVQPAAGQTLRIFTQSERLNLPAILEGQALQGGDILLSPVFAAANNYQIGDELRILEKTFRVAGFMALPNYIYPLQSEVDMMPPPGFGVAVMRKADFAALGKGSRFYAVKFNQPDPNPPSQSVQFRQLLQERGVDILEWTDIDDNKRVNIVAAEVQILTLVSRAVPSVILVLASVMVGNVIARLIHLEAPIIGALYALGYKRKEIYRHYLIFPLLIAITGGILGAILGTYPVRWMVQFMLTAFIMPLTGIVFDPALLAAGLLLPVLFLGGGGYLVIRKGLRHSPVVLMRGKEENNQVNFLERMLRLDRLGFAARFQLREQLRSLSRLVFLLGGIIVATLLLLWGFTIKSSTDYILNSGVNTLYNFEYEYKFNQLRTDPLPAGAEPFSAGLFLPQAGDKRDFYVTGVVPGSAMLALEDENGAPLSTGQVIVMKPVAELLQVKPGNSVTIIRKLDGRSFSLQIDGIADSYAGKFIFMPLADFNRLFELPDGSYMGAFSNVRLDIPEEQSYSMVSLEEKMAGVQEIVAPVQSLIGMLSTIAFFIGVIVIYVVTSLIVEENKRTISLLKIFGYRKKEVNALILNSSTIVVVVGYLLGIPLIMAAMGVLIQSMEDSVGLLLPAMTISPLYLLIGFIVVMLAFELSKRLCRKKVNAIPMSEALKSGME